MSVTATGDVPAAVADRVWVPRPWRNDCRRTDLRRVGRFTHERALRKADIKLSPGAHHVAAVLASYGDQHGGNIFPSQHTLAKVCRRSVRHVRAKLRELTELGLLRRLSHGGGRPSHHGRRRRVTPARYELTLPLWLIDEPGPTGADSGQRTHPPSTSKDGKGDQGASPKSPARRATQSSDELSPHVVGQIREALGVTTLTTRQAEDAVGAAVARASGLVHDRIAYALRVIRSDPAAFRPTPDVTEPACPRHGQHRATRCPVCAAARSDPPPAWRRMRASLRQARSP